MAFRLAFMGRGGTRPATGTADQADAQAQSSLWRRLGSRLGWRQQSTVPVQDGSSGVRLVTIEGRSYVFGLEWRLIPPTRALTRTLSLAKKEGKALFVISEMEDIIGLGGPVRHRGPKVSAALHLATQFSQGGLELYAFELADRQVAVVALNESRPIPGFDFVGEPDAARALIEEFLAIQMGQPIRQVGNVGLLEGEETVAPEDLFAQPARSARIRHLRSEAGTRLLLALALLGALVLTGFWFWFWLDRERHQVLEQNAQLAQSQPELVYRRSLSEALARLDPAGQAPLQAWIDTALSLPLMNAGWRLVHVHCKQRECVAQWDRLHGSFSDFQNSLPPHTLSVEEVQIQNSPLRASVLSKHGAGLPSQAIEPIDPAQLPGMREGLRQISDQLQDLSLLGAMSAQMERPALFGGQGDPAQLPQPVFHGSWSLTHELWVLSHVRIAPHAVVTSLEFKFFDERGASDERLTIKGAYYVRADR